MTDPNTNRTVAVAGATGFVGRNMVRELLSRGFRVRALTRSMTKATDVLPLDAIDDGRVAVVEGDALERGVPGRLVDGADVCVNLIGILREAPGRQTFERVHTKTTAALVDACERHGCSRYLQMSALGVGANAPTEYYRTKYAAEQAVQLSRLDWTIFRPGLIHGPDGEFMHMVQDWCMGRAAPWFFIPYFTRVRVDTSGVLPAVRSAAPMVAPVRVEDVCAAFASAIDCADAVGEIYTLVGPETLRFDELLRTVRDTLPLGRHDMPLIGIPGDLAALKARAMGLVGMGGLLPFDAGMAIMGRSDSVADTSKARRDLGFEPEPFTDSFRAYADQM